MITDTQYLEFTWWKWILNTVILHGVKELHMYFRNVFKKGNIIRIYIAFQNSKVNLEASSWCIEKGLSFKVGVKTESQL